MTIGEKIRKIREKKGMTRDDIIRKTDLTTSTLYKIETNRMPKPSFDIIAKIAKALDCTLDDLT
jgi:transcriptional regulator with XRE-family HTH domain